MRSEKRGERSDEALRIPSVARRHGRNSLFAAHFVRHQHSPNIINHNTPFFCARRSACQADIDKFCNGLEFTGEVMGVSSAGGWGRSIGSGLGLG